jgi:RsiW-degrading membrane proteinase PrsW (M82 family)
LSHDRYNKEPRGLLSSCLSSACWPSSRDPSRTNVSRRSLPFLERSLLSAFIGVALVEEGVKYLGARLFSYRNRAYDEIYDGVIYCVCVSLGFATVENILYVMQTGVSTAVIRAVTAVPAHTIFAIVMGYYMSIGRFYTQGKFFIS